MKKKEVQEGSIYIRALKFGSGRGWFSFNELIASLKIEPQSSDELILFAQIKSGHLFKHNVAPHVFTRAHDEKQVLHMTVEDEFRLLEYVELQEARASSRSATRFATAALIISIVGTFASIGVSLCERFGWLGW